MDPIIQHFTRGQLAFEPYAFRYELPFSHHGKTNDAILHETVLLLKQPSVYCPILDECIVHNNGTISLYFRYEGWEEYHPFSFDLRIVFIDDMDRIALLGHIHQDIHDLFEIVIRQLILPTWSQLLGLVPMP
jgi:hypothetical protein